MKPSVLFIFVGLVLVSCGPPPPEAVAPALTAVEPEPLTVVTREAVEQPMPRYLRVTGQLQASQEALLAADAPGKVVSAPIERGTRVKAGDILMKLDDRAAQLALQEADAALLETRLKVEWQKTELERNVPLAKTNAISDRDFQRLKVDVAAAEAGLAAGEARRDTARKQLTDMTLRAPFDGTIAERLVEVGEYVGSNSQVASLVATESLRLVLNVPETAIGSVAQGQKAGFMVPAYPGEEFHGTIRFVGAAVREASRDLVVEATVENADGRLRPGMFAEGRLILSEEPGVAVPLAALKVEGPLRRVFVVESGVIVERLVEVGETKGDLVEIRRGVAKGESVVVDPAAEAADGRKVRLTALR
jgi:RND family efflux transporter MFP subunit